MIINSISYSANYTNTYSVQKHNFSQNVSMKGKLPSKEVKISKFKRFLHKFFNKIGRKSQTDIAVTEQHTAKPIPKKTYKTKAMKAAEPQPVQHISVERVNDPYDQKVKNVYSNGVLIDKVYGRYLTDSYWRIRYEAAMPIESKGNIAGNYGKKMQFRSGYGQNFRKTEDKAITVFYNKNANSSGILKTFKSKVNDVEVELYKDINNGNYERRISKRVNSLIKSDIYCLRSVPELLVIYEKPGDFNGVRSFYKFNNKSERIYRHSIEDGYLKRFSTVTYQNVLENPDDFPMEVVEIVNRNISESTNTNLINDLVSK